MTVNVEPGRKQRWVKSEVEFVIAKRRAGLSPKAIEPLFEDEFGYRRTYRAIAYQLVNAGVFRTKRATDHDKKPKRRATFERDLADAAKLEPTVSACDISDLPAGSCKWPYGKRAPFAYCGRPADGPYCSEHHKLATGPGTRSERAVAPMPEEG